MNIARSPEQNLFVWLIVPYLSLEGLIAADEIAWGLRMLWPDCNMCGKPSYALVMEIFHFETVLGLVLLLTGLAKVFATERPASRFAEPAHTLFCVCSFIVWPLIGLSLLWGDALSLGTLTYLLFGLASLAVFILGPSRT